MSEGFRGEFYQKVDGKARVSIPAAFRRTLEAEDPLWTGRNRPRVVMVYGDARRRFVDCFSIQGIARVEARIRALPEGTKLRRMLERNLITMAHTAEVDDDGRVVLPQRIKDKIEVTDAEAKAGFEAVFAGLLDSFNLWKRDVYEENVIAQTEADLEELPEGTDLMALLNGAGAGG